MYSIFILYSEEYVILFYIWLLIYVPEVLYLSLVLSPPLSL